MQSLDTSLEVLSMEIKDERLPDREDQALVSAKEDALELVGVVGFGRGVLFEPVGDLLGTGRIS